MQINLHIAISKPYFCITVTQSWCMTFSTSKKVNLLSLGVNFFSKQVKSLRFLRFYLNNRVNLFRVNQGLVMSCIPVQHGVSLILPQETSPSCANKNCLHLSCVPVQFSFNITLRLYCQFGLRQIANASIYSPCTKFQFLFSSCSISRSAILPVFGRSIVRVELSYGYPTVIYRLSYGVYCCLVWGDCYFCTLMYLWLIPRAVTDCVDDFSAPIGLPVKLSLHYPFGIPIVSV